MPSIMPKNVAGCLLLVCLVLFMTGVSFSNPADDCTVYGSLQINGQDASIGRTLEAYIDGEKIVSDETTQSGQYSLTIPRYDPSDPDQKGYNSETDIVVIKVDGREAEPTINPSPGSMKVNLEVKTSLNVKLTTWGKIKALFK
ncbi:MAG: hypothetical protein GWN00_17905 [Aliifodinibius sp.]|nr:hypothetical protein [Fodinibius sp.]NIW42078.1 hypothetical protein [candidate division Zixibacteria bacterium]NIY26609.1 hypothetical protein [Fodinibius sp.]